MRKYNYFTLSLSPALFHNTAIIILIVAREIRIFGQPVAILLELAVFFFLNVSVHVFY